VRSKTTRTGERVHRRHQYPRICRSHGYCSRPVLRRLPAAPEQALLRHPPFLDCGALGGIARFAPIKFYDFEGNADPFRSALCVLGSFGPAEQFERENEGIDAFGVSEAAFVTTGDIAFERFVLVHVVLEDYSPRSPRARSVTDDLSSGDSAEAADQYLSPCSACRTLAEAVHLIGRTTPKTAPMSTRIPSRSVPTRHL
jgi:hypothetical protein